MPRIIWTGVIDDQTFRVIDLGPNLIPRLEVEILGSPDAMGTPRWNRFDPIPTTVFSRMLIDSGVVS